ncbi:MAG TPA: hypothetical protein VFP54_11405 [Acidimicrobiales bacterium]|nr:hypothetical protein [Acidimicrobiales bacterium]
MVDGPLGDELDYQVLLATLRQGQEGVAEHLARLGERLAAALPGSVSLQRSRRLFRSEVTGLTVEAGERRYTAAVGPHGIDCAVGTVVRGVVLKTDPRSFDEWLEQLSGDLAALAERNMVLRAALERMMGGA